MSEKWFTDAACNEISVGDEVRCYHADHAFPTASWTAWVPGVIRDLSPDADMQNGEMVDTSSIIVSIIGLDGDLSLNRHGESEHWVIELEKGQ